jgi:tetratricopeptide (TPR) repeat protein
MKKNYLSNILLVLTIAGGLGWYLTHKKVQAPIPPLRERQGPISTTSEWLNTKAAIQGLQSKLRAKPNDLQSKLLLALAYMQEARVTGEHPYYYPAALQLINDILDQKPENRSLLYEATVAKASIQLSLHQFAEALKTGQEALQYNNHSASIYGVLTDANVELGRYEEAIKTADQMVALRPDLKSYSRVSYLREIHGDMPGAIQAMQMAVSAGYPGLEQTVWTTVTLGNLYEKTGDLKNAALAYNQALAQYPKYAFALAGLGRLAVKNKKEQEALKLFTEAANTLPEFSFQEELVRLYQQKGDKKRADKIMQELLAGMEEDQEAGHIVDLELATIHLELGQNPDEALEYALKEFSRRPDNIEVCKTLAHIYYKKQDYQKASAYLQKATRTNSQDPALLCLNGLVNYRLGKQVPGEALIRKSLSINPYQDTPLSREGKNLLHQSVSKL